GQSPEQQLPGLGLIILEPSSAMPDHGNLTQRSGGFFHRWGHAGTSDLFLYLFCKALYETEQTKAISVSIKISLPIMTTRPSWSGQVQPSGQRPRSPAELSGQPALYVEDRTGRKDR